MPLTASPRNSWLVLGLIALAVVSYLLPWLIGGSIGLSFGAYDLGEWISLRLPERPMQTVLLLRAVPVLIAVLIGLFGAQQRRWSGLWWLAGLSVVLIAVALLPPFEYFLDGSLRGDVNYSQQFQLAGVALILGIIALSGIFRRVHVIATVLVALVIVGLTIYGLLQSWVLVEGLGLIPQLGLGPIVLIGSVLLLGALSAVSELRNSRH